jgi:hypothetical protein
MNRPKRRSSEAVEIDPASISRFKKERFLKQYSEDDFRDRVVRPLFLKKNLRDGRDLCGPMEHGKDCVFINTSPLGDDEVWAVQTKVGNLNLGRKAPQNIVEAITQLKTALGTPVPFPAKRAARKPNRVYLCVAGKMNESARTHVVHEIDDPRIMILDSDDLIPMIDEVYAELWYGIDADRNPYLKKLMEYLVQQSDTIAIVDLGDSDKLTPPITEEAYLPLSVYRIIDKVRKVSGQSHREPELQQLPATGIVAKGEPLVFLLGDAGDGKSTTLRRIAYDAAEKAMQLAEGVTLPVFLRAPDVASSDKPLVDLAAECTSTISGQNNAVFDLSDLLEGRVLILIDALDEVSGTDSRQDVLTKITSFGREYPSCKVILSSRPYQSIMSLKELAGFVDYRISPIDIKKTKSLITRLARGRSLPVAATQELMRRLQDIHGINLNPLLITVFVATSDFKRKDIPPNITELFKKYTELLLGRWDQRKGLELQYQAPLKDFLLKRVAIVMHKKRVSSIPLSLFTKIVETELLELGREGDTEQCLDEILSRTGLLRLDNDQVEFRHMLLQEFFAGRAITSIEELTPFLQDEWWRKAVVFYFGDNPNSYSQLATAMEKASTLERAELYHAAVTIGLALQACYLTRVTDKSRILEWVMTALALTYEPFISHLEADAVRYPHHEFLEYYIIARDAVASDVIRSIPEDFCGDASKEDQVARFWYIAGLIEVGDLERASKAIKDFKPCDKRLLFGLFLGCFLIAKLRISSSAERKLATAICDIIAPTVGPLMREVQQELNTLLLEMRRGRITAIDSPRETDDDDPK